MHETRLTQHTRSALEAAELPVEEPELPLRASRRDTIGRLALLCADMVAVVLSTFIVTLLPFSEAVFTAWVLAFLPLYALLAKMGGLYDRDQFVLHKTTLDEAPTLVAVAAIFALAVEGVQAIQYTGGSHPLPLWAILTATLVVTRGVARFVTVRTTATERVLVIGDAPITAVVRRKLSADPALNATVVGRVGMETPHEEPADTSLGAVDDLSSVLDQHHVDRVVVAPVHHGGEDVVDIIRLATACGVRVAVFPRMLEVIGTSVEFDDLGGQHAAGRARLRSLALLAISQALLRHRGGQRDVDPSRACPAVDRADDQGRLPRPHPVLPDASGPKWQGVPDAEVPHDGAWR